MLLKIKLTFVSSLHLQYSKCIVTTEKLREGERTREGAGGGAAGAADDGDAGESEREADVTAGRQQDAREPSVGARGQPALGRWRWRRRWYGSVR